MIRTAILIAGAGAAVAVAQTPPPKSFWTKTADRGAIAYQTGSFDQPIDGGLRIACRADGGASLTTQIKGVAPAAGGRLLLVVNARRASQSFAFTTDARGMVAIPHTSRSSQFRRLWTALRSNDTVTIRYPDNSFTVQSLVGARTTLPTRPCG